MLQKKITNHKTQKELFTANLQSILQKRPGSHTVDGSEIPRPTTVWMVLVFFASFHQGQPGNAAPVEKATQLPADETGGLDVPAVG